MTPQIKKLQWRIDDVGDWVCGDLGLSYEIWPVDGVIVWKCWGLDISREKHEAETIDDAKAACQADFEARVMAVIEDAK